MPNVARNGTKIVHESGDDGELIASQTTVFAEGTAVGRVGDKCSEHEDGVVAPNTSTVYVEGVQIARVGDVTTCDPPGELMPAGSATTVFADDGAGV